MFRAGYANKVVKKFLEENNEDILFIEIAQILEKHNTSEASLTNEEKVLVGLRYSEFLANGSADSSILKIASELQSVLLETYKICIDELTDYLKVFGWN